MHTSWELRGSHKRVLRENTLAEAVFTRCCSSSGHYCVANKRAELNMNMERRSRKRWITGRYRTNWVTPSGRCSILQNDPNLRPVSDLDPIYYSAQNQFALTKISRGFKISKGQYENCFFLSYQFFFANSIARRFSSNSRVGGRSGACNRMCKLQSCRFGITRWLFYCRYISCLLDVCTLTSGEKCGSFKRR